MQDQIPKAIKDPLSMMKYIQKHFKLTSKDAAEVLNNRLCYYMHLVDEAVRQKEISNFKTMIRKIFNKLRQQDKNLKQKAVKEEIHQLMQDQIPNTIKDPLSMMKYMQEHFKLTSKDAAEVLNNRLCDYMHLVDEAVRKKKIPNCKTMIRQIWKKLRRKDKNLKQKAVKEELF